MALNFFSQKDIEKMIPDNVPERFINYFAGLSPERKEEIISTNPKLAEVLGYAIDNISEDSEDEMAGGSSNETTDEADVHETVVVEEVKKKSFGDIEINIYDGKSPFSNVEKEIRPFHALAVEDNPKKCFLHRTSLEKKQITYKIGRGSYGVVVYYCSRCNRLYMEQSKITGHEKRMTDYEIPHKLYGLELTNSYLRSQMEAILLEDNEKIYIPDTWIEEHPLCPIHSVHLEKWPYVKKYVDRYIEFNGYYCNKCNKIMLRRSKAADIEDQCNGKGIPIEFLPIAVTVPKKNPIPKNEVKPDYFIQDGKCVEYNFNHNSDCFRLTEEDTVVISDSMYCSLEGHNTEEVLVMIWLNQKRGGRKPYLVLGGFCSQCEKYYMDEADYKVIYSVGRPEIMVLNDTEAEYFITSGEVFDIEREHLGELEGEFDQYIDEVMYQSDYVNPYAVGDYDDGNLGYAKSISKHKYSDSLDKVRGYKPKPYTYRVDITFAGKTEVYYVGASDIEMNGKQKVISFNSKFGNELVNYRTVQITKDGKKYDIKLSRQFDIENAELFNYVNLRTDEDIIFRSGVTDPFLVKVLNMRKKQHNLVDIIATIQENQNAIVDAGFNRNFIVQGCAGSGKTMVLLHRLSNLQYNHPEFDFDNSVILTPNDQFSLHIKGLAIGLQIGNIERISVEQYYVEMLLQYSEDFKQANKLASEVFVKQLFVDYVYSDEFRDSFNQAYDRVMEDRNEIIDTVFGLSDAMQESRRGIDTDIDSEVIPQIKRSVDYYAVLIRAKEKEIQEAEDVYNKLLKKKIVIEEKLPEALELVNKIVKETLPRVNAKIGTLYNKTQHEINEQQRQLDTIVVETQKVSSSFLPFGKKQKIDDLNKESDRISSKLRIGNKLLKDLEDLFDHIMTEKSDEDVLEWMKRVVLLVPEIREDIRLCERARTDLDDYLSEQSTIDSNIFDAQVTLNDKKQSDYTKEVYQAVAYLQGRINHFSITGTYSMIFDNATSEFKKANQVKSIAGIHRYDLYAELLFAMRFFKKMIGTKKFVCVDEGQDMAFNEYRLIYELNKNDVIYNIYGDVNQLLKPGRGISNWNRILETFHAETFKLNENYRNTNQITRFCNDSFDMHVLQTGVDGAKVREIPRRDLEKELAALNVANERIAILIPAMVLKRDYIDTAILPSNIKDIIGDKIDNGYISFMYVDEVKGIEFDKVYVISNRMSRNEKYIAYTRALSELVIVVDENISDIKEDGISLIGKLAEKVYDNKLDEAKNILEQITAEQKEKQKLEFFMHMFSRVLPFTYTQLIQVMWPIISKYNFRKIFTELDEEVQSAIRSEVDKELIVKEIYEAREYDKLLIWLDTCELWGMLPQIIEGVERKDILLKSNRPKLLKLYVDENLKDKDILESIAFLKKNMDWLNAKFAFDYCIELIAADMKQYSLIKEILLYLTERNKGSKKRLTVSNTNIVKLATMTRDEDEFEIIKDLLENYTRDLFSYNGNARYPEEVSNPEIQAALENLIHSDICLNNKMYIYMNTKLRKEILLENFMKYLADECGVLEHDCIEALSNYWIKGKTKYVEESGLVRVIPHNIFVSRLVCFDSKKTHISGQDGKWVEPEEGKKIFFKIKEFKYEGDLITLHYPCEKIEYADVSK